MKTRAVLKGELLAKREALATVDANRGLGRYILGGVILTSAFHVFSVLGGVHLPDAVHIAAALLQVVGMELSVWYLLAANGASKVAGIRSGWVAPAYYLALNGLLNAAYFLSSTAGLPLWATSVLPVVTALWVAALILYIPVAVSSLENARHRLGEARLVLLGDIARLEDELGELEEAGPGTDAPHVNVDARTVVVAAPPTSTATTTSDREMLAGLLGDGTGDVLELPKRGVRGTSTDTARRDRIAALLKAGVRSKSAIFREVGGNRAKTFALIEVVAAEEGVVLPAKGTS